jgi:hypothetical protein
MAGTKYSYLNTFVPLPWQQEPWRDVSPVLLLTGSAGGGKSVLAAEKVHAYMLKYPGSTGLILRKVRATMANSVVLMFKRHVVGNDSRVVHRPSDFRFEYSNGSILAYGGMKDEEQRQHIRSIGQSGGLDIAWMEEATQFTEEDFNELIARMRGNAATWRQIILTTNPDAPGHWINNRLILGGEASVYYSKATDNPYNPGSYMEGMSKMTGVEYQRLVLGKWVIGSGRVLDTWDDLYNHQTGKDNGGNVTKDAEYIPGGGPVVWTVDDGYTGKMDENTRMFNANSHPRAFLLVQKRHDGQLAIFGESLKIHTLADDHIKSVLAMSDEKGWPRPRYAIHDRAAASLGGALHKFGIDARYNQVPVDESIKEMRQWIAADDNNFRRLIAHPRCVYLRNQFASYSMSDTGAIIKAYDDTADAVRYLIWDESYGMSHTVDIVSLG